MSLEVILEAELIWNAHINGITQSEIKVVWVRQLQGKPKYHYSCADIRCEILPDQFYRDALCFHIVEGSRNSMSRNAAKVYSLSSRILSVIATTTSSVFKKIFF